MNGPNTDNRQRSAFVSPLAPRPSRRGFSLIEMLIVVTIMMILVAAASTTFRVDESRRYREAAGQLNLYLASARNRAMETGRPCGVILHRLAAAPAAVMDIDQCEVPPCYCGDTEDSVASVVATAGVNSGYPVATLVIASAPSVPVPPPLGMIKIGDLIQLNNQGPLYQIRANPNNPDTGKLDLMPVDTTQNPLVPWDGNAKLVPYRIYRSPMDAAGNTLTKGGASPLQLPAGAVVDLQWSGKGTDTAAGADVVSFPAAGTDVCILFSPNGSIERVYSSAPFVTGPVMEPIFLLIGKRERIDTTAIPNNPPLNETDMTNFQDLNNVWLVINPHTGLVTTDVVTAGTSTTPAIAIAQARLLARESQGMGVK